MFDKRQLSKEYQKVVDALKYGKNSSKYKVAVNGFETYCNSMVSNASSKLAHGDRTGYNDIVAVKERAEHCGINYSNQVRNAAGMLKHISAEQKAKIARQSRSISKR